MMDFETYLWAVLDCNLPIVKDEIKEIIIKKVLEYQKPTVIVDNYAKVYQDGLRKGLSERPQGECKSCKYYNPYFEQLTHIPRGDGYCAIARMTPEGMNYINCHDEWFCSDFCPKCGEDKKGGAE